MKIALNQSSEHLIGIDSLIECSKKFEERSLLSFFDFEKKRLSNKREFEMTVSQKFELLEEIKTILFESSTMDFVEPIVAKSNQKIQKI